jgi:hypothetical protein
MPRLSSSLPLSHIEASALAYAIGLSVKTFASHSGKPVAIATDGAEVWENTCPLSSHGHLTPKGVEIFSPVWAEIEAFKAWHARTGRHYGDVRECLKMLCFDSFEGVESHKYSEDVARFYYFEQP